MKQWQRLANPQLFLLEDAGSGEKFGNEKPFVYTVEDYQKPEDIPTYFHQNHEWIQEGRTPDGTLV